MHFIIRVLIRIPPNLEEIFCYLQRSNIFKLFVHPQEVSLACKKNEINHCISLTT